MKTCQAYRFALDPTPAQERTLRSHAGAARFAWNWGLAKCKERYEAEGKWYSGTDLHKLWNAEKKLDPALGWWAGNSKCAYQEAFRDLDRATGGRSYYVTAGAAERADRSGAVADRAESGPQRSCDGRCIPGKPWTGMLDLSLWHLSTLLRR